jgi:hypothetical protein
LAKFLGETISKMITLVPQNVRREHGGTYYCLASNAHGNGSSNPVHLNVQCKTLRNPFYFISIYFHFFQF